jgi:zinc and cadmium transporter
MCAAGGLFQQHSITNPYNSGRASDYVHPLDIHWIYTFGSVALVAGAAFTGMVALALSPHRLSRVIPLLVSLAAGALLGTAFGHLLPESVEQIGPGRKLSALLLAGFATFFVLEKLLGIWGNGYSEDANRPHVAHGIHQHGSIKPYKHSLAGSHSPMVGNLLVGAAIHSFIDGMAIATGYSARTYLGVVTTIAVLCHETPHHIGDVSILIHKGIPVMRSVLLSLMAAGTAALGALLVLLLGTRLAGVTTILLPFTTANFLYIASASLLPELQQERGLRQSLAQMGFFLFGSLLMFVSSGMPEPQ